ncbi:hypothetical protein [Frigoriglobus tundricola]|nr:hypothetical protein [Frigoriglobus tundricola]
MDEQMRAKLGKDEPVMICTADGVVLGYFTPTTQPQKLKLEPQIDEEEIARRLADRTPPTYTTEEVIIYLRGLEKGQ